MDQTIRQIQTEKCTGCGACLNKCPKNAIRMELNKEGFYFPTIDESLCVDCGLCLKTCPVTHPVAHHPTPQSYAVWASDEIRKESSSGGMFTLLADYVLSKGGVVFGARYSEDYMTVYHASAQSQETLLPLKKSKYVQSDTQLTYREAKQALVRGQLVLYTGCPCQIAGLYNYLGQDYENLITADIVCHGANSVTAYQSFVREFSDHKPIERVDFRDKVYFTWSTPTVIYLKDGTVKKTPWDKGTWYLGFLNGIINRLNCYSCPYACAERVADLTLADCWQVHRINPAYDDRKGTSLILTNSEKGRRVFSLLHPNMKLCEEVPLEELRKYNGQLNKPTTMHPCRKFFFSHLPSHGYHKALWYGRGMRFDVGIVGWWFASNHGSALTYYALGSLLQERGLEVLFVPIGKVNGTPWEPEIQQTVRFIGQHFKVGKDRSYQQMREFNKFCDAFMLGSDQMWTAQTISLVGYTFFLDFVDKTKKKIAFSTSFGHDQFQGTSIQIDTARDFLHRFDAISVREQSGVSLCEQTFGIHAEQVIDPVFLCQRKYYDRLTETISEEPPSPYLLCYILDPTEEKERAAEAIAAHTGLKVITILGIKEYKWAVKKWHTGHVLPPITTDRFLWYVRHCSFMLTDSHHGTCFAIIYHRPYAALVNISRGRTRFETIAKCLGLEDRLFDSPSQLIQSDRPYRPIDYDQVERLLDSERTKAVAWLERALTLPTSPALETINTAREEGRREGPMGVLQHEQGPKLESLAKTASNTPTIRPSSTISNGSDVILSELVRIGSECAKILKKETMCLITDGKSEK